MKIYCEICDKVQPVRVDDCLDAKTNKPFQDIVCNECDLVIAAGTGIKREWVGLTDEEVMEIAFNFDVPSLVVRTVEAKLREKNA
jgi:hypothetical protein